MLFRNTSTRQQGFSLVEMSIVLVIIAIILGAVIAGRSIQENAQAQAVIIEANNYLGAIENFRKKYRYLPGDHPEPERFFTGSAATAGDGDSRWDTANERDTAWFQLYQSGLISHEIIADGSAAATPGTDRPASRIENAGWTLLDVLTQTLPDTSTITAVQVLRLGAREGTPTEFLATGTLVPKQHDYIDAKVDVKDTPISGNYIVGWEDTANFNGCVSNGGGYTYNIGSSTRCTANFIRALK